MHVYSIDEILGWTRDGIIWLLAAILQLAFLVTVPHDPPSWWYRWWSWNDWYFGSDNDYHPYPELGMKFLLGCWRLLGEWVNESANYYSNQVGNVLRAIIGTLPAWAGTVALGLTSLLNKVGAGVLLWANSAIEACQRLFDWLPNEIKYAGQTWAQIWNTVEMTVWNWVLARYEDARNLANQWRDWLSSWGNQIQSWYASVYVFVNNLIAQPYAVVTGWLGSAWSFLYNVYLNPVGFVLGILGAAWTRLVAFEQNCLTYFYNLWSQYAEKLSEFIADPLLWLYSRAEDWLLTHVW